MSHADWTELLAAAEGAVGPGDRYLDSRIARLERAVSRCRAVDPQADHDAMLATRRAEDRPGCRMTVENTGAAGPMTADPAVTAARADIAATFARMDHVSRAALTRHGTTCTLITRVEADMELRIAAFQRAHNYGSRAHAVRALIELGLRSAP